MPGLRIYNNIYSLNSQRQLGLNTTSLGDSLSKLSSGLRVNSAKDDAAAMAVSTNLRADIASMEQAIRNTNDSVSLLAVTEGALSETSLMLVRMRELSMEAATTLLTSGQRSSVNNEYSNLMSEITRMSLTTEFNGQLLLNGSLSSAAATTLNVQVGIDNSSSSRINLNSSVDLTNMDVTSLGLDVTSITTADSAQSAITIIDAAINTVSVGRGNIGAVQNRLERTITNLEIAVENTSAADSRLRDADMAKEISIFTRNQILVQSSTAMLSQANLIPQSVLQLLQ
ncbi:MAG: flagellin FliC [Nitrospinae bacterium]|nr:flagellin FliC [Nitrospinota bacterium]